MRRVVAACAAGLALFALVTATPSRAAEPTLDLTGTWHVLIHYRDDTAHDPKQVRWDDRLWIFQRDANGLEWTEYPIVVFEDETGRFEKLGTNRAQRVVGAWEPSPVQLAQIQSGLEYNSRGTKTKKLRGSDAGGWSSGARGSWSGAANVITYSETWSIQGLPTKPVFTRDDILGSASTENVEGRTQYLTESVEAGGDLLHGTFERDGTRHGTFTMRRSGSVKITEGSGKSQSQRNTEVFFKNFGSTDFFSADELRVLKEVGGAQKDDKELRNKVRAEIESKAREQGIDPALIEPQIDRLSEKISSMIQQGKSPEEIERALNASSPRP